MKCEVEIWTIGDLVDSQLDLELTPAYQRGVAWQAEKQSLLLDSIFRGYDLPKLYLAQKSDGLAPHYEVVDGQQRVRAIWDFWNGKIAVPSDCLVESGANGRVRRAELSDSLLARFSNFEITVSILKEATPTEKRTFFARLQLGERLNPAELRNAMASAVPRQLRSIALTHTFFRMAGIPDKRFNRDDYLTHVFAHMDLVRSDDWKDIKAPSLKKYVARYAHGVPRAHLREVSDILDTLAEVTRYAQRALRNKWSFVDACLYVRRHVAVITPASLPAIGRQLNKIEELRKKHTSHPERLLRSDSTVPHSSELYDYILAYKAGGGLRESVEARSRYLDLCISI